MLTEVEFVTEQFKVRPENVDHFPVTPSRPRHRPPRSVVAIVIALGIVATISPWTGATSRVRGATRPSVPETSATLSSTTPIPSDRPAFDTTGEVTEERLMLDAVAHQPPRQVFALVAAGRSLARARYREAIGLLEEAAPAAGSFPIFQRRMATALLCSGDRTGAEKWMRTAVAALPSATNTGYLAMAVGGLRWDCADPASVSEFAADGNASEALRWGRQAAALSAGPDQQLWLGVSAELAVRAHDTAALRSVVALLGFVAPQSVAALRYGAWLHVFDGDLGGADAILDRLRARSGRAPRATDLRVAASLAT